MALQWLKATVTEKKIWTEGLFTIRVKAPGVQPFKPGQFLQLGVEGPEKHIHRPYSVGSPHGEELEFYIVLVEDGELTPKLWAMDVGDELDISEKAAGSFTLDKTPDAKHLWLVATGTGLAPYIAMLRTDEPWDRYEKIVVVHGVRYAADLAYVEELNEYGKKYSGRFSYVPMLTREESPGTLKSRIPQALEDGSLENAANCTLQSDDSAILLCGNPAMLDEMEEKLGQREMRKHKRKEPGQIVLERYW